MGDSRSIEECERTGNSLPSTSQATIHASIRNTRQSVRLGVAGSRSSHRVDERKSNANGRGATGLQDKFSFNALGKVVVDASVLTLCAGRVRGKSGKISVQLLCGLTIGKLKTTSSRRRNGNIRRRACGSTRRSGGTTSRTWSCWRRVATVRWGSTRCVGGVGNDTNELRSSGNGTLGVGRAGSGGADSGLIKWNGSRHSKCQSTNKFRQVSANVLTLVQSVKLWICRRLITIRDGYRVGRVARLLNKDLSEREHPSTAQRLGEVNHFVCSVLLTTVTSGREQGRGSADGNRVALLTTTGCVTSILPWCNSVYSYLSNSLVKEWGSVNGNEEKGENKLNHGENMTKKAENNRGKTRNPKSTRLVKKE